MNKTKVTTMFNKIFDVIYVATIPFIIASMFIGCLYIDITYREKMRGLTFELYKVKQELVKLELNDKRIDQVCSIEKVTDK